MKKTVMITGGSKGLGRALALTFAKKGARIAVCARGKHELNLLEREIIELGGEVLAVQANISIAEEADRFVSLAEEAYGYIDVLINNASIFGPGPLQLADYTENAFKEVLEVNILNPFLMTKRVLSGMLIRQQGSIINLTSEAGKTGFAEWGAYGISKFAVEGMTQTWADELKDTGVRMNMVDPGEMDTEMHRTAVPDCDYDLANPLDHLDIFLYLASNQSALINGQRFEAQSFSYKEGRA
ncbi:SDR family NAD(P)-dependent oxidoreductase [Bacillus sp. SJS]|uniref:SDR family NAD(P)-dependent oxidoreductase n=1 Tax=Bacillus sp. SJS TaxID=1423321 RepID=UPI0004DD3F65|nr:SDR family oxidoreductase [Bacillus sp. SJS]KZZ83010.1 3-oxoacyl-ACP reductase [Bacillus sp. SJS]